MTERNVAVTTHGRYLVIPPSVPGPAPVLVGFHGYAEDAETQLERLHAIPGSGNWVLVSIQGLHRFYQRSSNRVVAGWMTRQDRELAIADNLAYVQCCLEAIAAEWEVLPAVVFAGFSQGVAMAYRAAANATCPAAGVIANGGDIPPELTRDQLKRIPAAVVLRGKDDQWYTREKFREDERRLRESSVNVQAIEFDGAHEWRTEDGAALSKFLCERIPS